jgi:hypothetical protein
VLVREIKTIKCARLLICEDASLIQTGVYTTLVCGWHASTIHPRSANWFPIVCVLPDVLPQNTYQATLSHVRQYELFCRMSLRTGQQSTRRAEDPVPDPEVQAEEYAITKRHEKGYPLELMMAFLSTLPFTYQ